MQIICQDKRRIKSTVKMRAADLILAQEGGLFAQGNACMCEKIYKRKDFLVKVRKLLAGILSAAAALGIMAFTAFAEEYTVSTNDELQTAVKNLQSGDTSKLKTGTYESIDILKDDIIIEGADENTVVTVSKVAQAFIGVNANNLTVKNIEFVVPEDVTIAPNYSWTGGFVAVISYWS